MKKPKKKMNKNSINKIMAFNLVVINISISAW